MIRGEEFNEGNVWWGRGDCLSLIELATKNDFPINAPSPRLCPCHCGHGNEAELLAKTRANNNNNKKSPQTTPAKLKEL